ncbi:restriction endonuclease subunit S [Streptomyces diastaticus]|uniref:restriction endonuclease subunit S n=1 Tax=Streptomyces diastaticus TaxID=1956 RepID=UPI0035DB77EE
MGGLPEGWSWAPLGDIVDVLDSHRIPVSSKERATRVGDVPYYGATGRVGCIDEALFDEDLVLLGEDGVQFFDRHKSKAYMVSGKSWVNNHAHVLRAGSGVLDWKYLCNYLNFFNYEGYANGTTRLKLTKSAMVSIPVPVPPIAEQHRIVEVLEEQLSRLDAAKESAARSLQRIHALESTLLVAALASTSKFTTLKDVLSTPLINGRSVKTMENGFPVLRLTALKGGRIDLGEFKEGAWDADDAHPFLVEEGDFLISRGNGTLGLVGRGGIVGEVANGVAFPDTMIRARVSSGIVLPQFLSLIWETRAVRRQIEGKARTTAGIYKVNQKILESVEFPLPSLDRQLEIVRRREIELGQLAAVRTAAEHALRRAGSLKRALLRKAFSGGLVPQDPADDPAATLLARIAAEREADMSVRKAAKRAARPRKAAAAAAATQAAPAPTPAPSASASVQQELFVQ